MIKTVNDLESLVARALDAGCVAVDTEFVWERTYYPKLGVVQLGFSEDECFLIDPTAFRHIEPLGRLMAAPDVVKILHDAQHDLAILCRATGTFPKTIFDTRRAAGFVGLGATLSLGGLVRKTLGVHLPKTQTRTDWLRRPLSKQQMTYALNDVRYLPATYAELLTRIRRRGREAWLWEELATYDDAALYEERDPDTQFERLAGSGRLAPRQRAVLRALAAWREREARRQDRPRGHVLDDKALAALARNLPRSSDAFTAIPGLSDKARRRYGPDLLTIIEQGLALPPEDHPPRAPRLPDDETLSPRVNIALAYLAGKSLADDVDPGLVASRAEVQALVAAGPAADPRDHALLRGWRRSFLGEDLLAILAGDRAVRLNPETGLPEISAECGVRSAECGVRNAK